MSKIALITGITGQDGSYLARHLLSLGYTVHGLVRRSSTHNTERLHDIENKIILHNSDLTDSLNVVRLVQNIQPHEIYHLGAMSHVKVSFETPEYTANTNAIGTLRLLEAIRFLGLSKQIKFYNAATSELYGQNDGTLKNEESAFYPRSPYGTSKLFAYWSTKNYRESYNLFAANGILFNHESPMRGKNFVSRKITCAVAAIAHNQQNKLHLGNLNAKRDWGHAKDYVKAMHLILQHHTPDDFVIATGQTKSVRDFLKQAFAEVGIHLVFQNHGIEEVGIIDHINADCFFEKTQNTPDHLSNGQPLIKVNPDFFRPNEIEELRGDASKAQKELNWKPEVSFENLVSEMVAKDLKNQKC